MQEELDEARYIKHSQVFEPTVCSRVHPNLRIHSSGTIKVWKIEFIAH